MVRLGESGFAVGSGKKYVRWVGDVTTRAGDVTNGIFSHLPQQTRILQDEPCRCQLGTIPVRAIFELTKTRENAGFGVSCHWSKVTLTQPATSANAVFEPVWHEYRAKQHAV